jgi:hypothetical protein
MKKVKQYFDNHGAADLLYFTSDKLAFFDEQNALNHAKRLEDPTVTYMTREEADLAIAEMEQDNRTDELLDELAGV